MAHILVPGAAGFIGSAVALRLLERGDTVWGIDNLNAYYEVSLKEARLARLQGHPAFRFERMDIADRAAMRRLFDAQHFDAIVHLAAQAGVRYSLENPAAYIDANLTGFGNVLEGARQGRTGHLVFASSSSVYGASLKLPFAESDNVDHPVSLYAATKKANELLAHSYAHLYALPCTGLRFFTVYGPWGRPDMAFFKFTRMIIAGQPIPVYNRGDMLRDFTYVDDVVEGVVRACRDFGVPLVTRGAGTGLSGGALPHRQGLTLALAKFNRILAVDPLARLSHRQRSILQLIAEGRTNKEMAAVLQISESTVDSHRTQLMRRLDVHDIASLVRFAYQAGVVEVE